MTVVDVGHECIELRGAKKVKMLRMMVNFGKGNLQESEQVTQNILNIMMGKSATRKVKVGMQGGSESVP